MIDRQSLQHVDRVGAREVKLKREHGPAALPEEFRSSGYSFADAFTISTARSLLLLDITTSTTHNSLAVADLLQYAVVVTRKGSSEKHSRRSAAIARWMFEISIPDSSDLMGEKRWRERRSGTAKCEMSGLLDIFGRYAESLLQVGRLAHTTRAGSYVQCGQVEGCTANDHSRSL